MPESGPESWVITPASWTDALDIAACFPLRQPLEVDLGCGKGRFLVTRATRAPHLNFLGVDRMLERIRKVQKKLSRAELDNVRLLRIEAAYAVMHLLPPASVSTYYIFFPDPWPKRRHHRRRLFSPEFLQALARTLVPGGCVHVATDHADYFTGIRKVFDADPAFESIPAFEPADDERTEFETLFREQGATIGRCSYRKA